MKKGFALLETMVVVTFLAVSLLLLYSSFRNMINNNKKNVYYDNASYIYEAYYLKEYLDIKNNTKLLKQDIEEITCDDFIKDGCKKIIEEFNIKSMYLAKTNIKEYKESSTLNNYLNSLSSSSYPYRFIIEIRDGNTYSYASMGIEELDYE